MTRQHCYHASHICTTITVSMYGDISGMYRYYGQEELIEYRLVSVRKVKEAS